MATGVSAGRAAFEKAEAFAGRLCVLSSKCSGLRATPQGEEGGQSRESGGRDM